MAILENDLIRSKVIIIDKSLEQESDFILFGCDTSYGGENPIYKDIAKFTEF